MALPPHTALTTWAGCCPETLGSAFSSDNKPSSFGSLFTFFPLSLLLLLSLLSHYLMLTVSLQHELPEWTLIFLQAFIGKYPLWNHSFLVSFLLSQVPSAQGRAWYSTTSPVLRPPGFLFFFFFFRVFERFPRRWPVSHFLILGTGRHVWCLHLENVITSLGITSNILWLGELTSTNSVPRRNCQRKSLKATLALVWKQMFCSAFLLPSSLPSIYC